MLKQKLKIIFCLCFFLSVRVFSQTFEIYKIEPPNWWTGMQHNEIQLMVYGKDLSDLHVVCEQQGIIIKSVQIAENRNYAFVQAEIEPGAFPGNYKLDFIKNEVTISKSFPVFQRNYENGKYHGFDSNDIIYLITPDRFANGDLSNDTVKGMKDTLNRENKWGRHGGDIQGIIDRLDYLTELGITAIWLNPLLENDMKISYHGYAATDLYKIDPRFGSNELYKSLVKEAHSRGLKIIMDHVSNHVGIYHEWMENLPMAGWLNGSIEKHERNRHNKTALVDSHADPEARRNTLEAWFVDEMPDLNQKNPFLARYLIENTIWWIEYADIDGIREDTYPYADQDFLSDWAREIFREYPKFNIVGEVWIHEPEFLAPFQKDTNFRFPFNSNLPVVTDFGLFDAFGRIFNRNESISNLYDIIAKDFLYSNSNNLLTFFDNHDVWRLMKLVDEDFQKARLVLKLLFTLRGIPQIYYGTEIGLAGGKDHGEIRSDFPGGFPGDSLNAFLHEGRSTVQNEIFEFTRKMISLRKKYTTLKSGRMIQFHPKEELYIFLRESVNDKIIVVVNNNNENKSAEPEFLSPALKKIHMLKNIETNEMIKVEENTSFVIPAKDALILQVIN